MENPEEILHSLEEFSKLKPKDIPRELEEYLCFVAKTGDPVYQWSAIKSLFREKMINVITEFYETCPLVEIPPCPNVDIFNYDSMKNFILEKLDTFAAAPFTVQRICELLTTPRKEYNRIDKYMRALEKNILVVSTIEPGMRRNTAENGDNLMNGLVSEHLETNNSDNVHMDINVDMDVDEASWVNDNFSENTTSSTITNENNTPIQSQNIIQETVVTDSKMSEIACSSSQDSVITCTTNTTPEETPQQEQQEPYVSIEPLSSKTCIRTENVEESDNSVTITAIPAGVQKRRNSVEPIVSSETDVSDNESGNQTETEAEIEKTKPITTEETETTSSIEEITADSSSSDNDQTERLDPEPDPLLLDAEEEPPETEIKEVRAEEIIENVEKVIQNNEILPPIETIKCSNIKFEEIQTADTVEEEISSSAIKEEEPQSSEQVKESQIESEAKSTSNEAKSIEMETEIEAKTQLETQEVVEEEIETVVKEEEKIKENIVEVTKSDDEAVIKAEATSDSSDLPL